MSALRAALPRAALYTGGFLGPFGGSVVVSMLPEMGADLGVTAATAATRNPTRRLMGMNARTNVPATPATTSQIQNAGSSLSE